MRRERGSCLRVVEYDDKGGPDHFGTAFFYFLYAGKRKLP